MNERINGRKHNEKCANATSKICRCGCQGRLHGIRAKNPQGKKQDLDETDEKTITVTSKMGGEIEDFLNLCKGKMIQCFCIGDRQPAENFKAYNFAQDRVDGLKDKDGKRWWVYWHCPNCGTDLAFWKIKNRLQVV